jgi:hypothetical protein
MANDPPARTPASANPNEVSTPLQWSTDNDRVSWAGPPMSSQFGPESARDFCTARRGKPTPQGTTALRRATPDPGTGLRGGTVVTLSSATDDCSRETLSPALAPVLGKGMVIGMRRGRIWSGLLTCGLALTLPLALAAPAGASPSGRNGGFAFDSEFGYKGLDADAIATTGPRARTLLQVLDYGPAEESYQSHPDWSPNGRWLVWGSNKSPGGSRLIVARANGSHRHTVFLSPGDSVDYPTWSPTGRRIAFTTSRGSIYTIHRNGTHLKRIAYVPGQLWGFDGLDWSSRGRLVAAHVTSSGDKLFTIRPDGTHRRNLGVMGSEPDWAPYGARLAYLGAGGHIWIMRADGSRKHRLHTAGTANGLSWAPDGSRIAYIRSSDSSILTVKLNGRGTKVLGHPRGVWPMLHLAWRPL